MSSEKSAVNVASHGIMSSAVPIQGLLWTHTLEALITLHQLFD